jgi:hypothetical protein
MLTFQTDFAVCGCSNVDSLSLMTLCEISLVSTETDGAVSCSSSVGSLRVMTLCVVALVLTLSE